jgi:small subunit ribosomal protein S4
MKIGPKYKIARRLGAPIFEKTQTQKFALSQARKEKSGKNFSRPKSEFGLQLLEKQKARFTYAVTEKQFSKYAKEALAKKDRQALSRLYSALELRADNVAYRAGFAPTRLAARQMVSHGHLLVNGKRITIPSYRLGEGDVLSQRVASMSKPLFASLGERVKGMNHPAWLRFDKEKNSATVIAIPKYEPSDSLFDMNAVLEFYSR